MNSTPRLLILPLLITSVLLVFSPPSYSQENDLQKLKSLNQQLIKLYRQGRYSEAIPIAKKALSIEEKTLGPNHPNVAQSLNNLAELYRILGDYKKAEPLYKRSLAIIEKVFGPDHPNVAKILNNLALLYGSLGNYSKAEPLYKRSLTIKEKALGPDHPSVATSLSSLAALYYSLGDYIKAEALFKRSLTIREKAFGVDHPAVASILNNLAMLYLDLGDYAKAETLFKRSLAINEKALGPDHPDVANSLNNLAGLYKSLSDYDKAEVLYERSLAIIEKVFGPDHPNVANSLNNLAVLYYSIGNYTKAESLYKRSLAVRENALGPDHPDVAQSLNNLAELYYFLGDYANAKPLYKRSLAIYEKAVGSEHPAVATTLNNLAGLYLDLGDYEKAGVLYKRSLYIREKTLGTDHPDVANSLYNIGSLYYSLGNFVKAEPFLKRSLTVREKALGLDHPDVAFSLNELAGLYYSLGDYTKSERLYKRSLAIREKALGPDHPDVAQSLNNLAGVYAAQDDFHKAHSMLYRAQQIDSKLIDQVMGFTSEDQKMNFLSMKKWDLYGFLSLVDQHLSAYPSFRMSALDIWLRRKGVILEAQKRFQEALIYSEDRRSVERFQELSRVRARLSKLAFAGPGNERLETYKKKIGGLKNQKERLEAELSKLSNAFSLKQKVSKADSGKVANALPKDSVLLEFARIGIINFKAKGKEWKWLPDHYIAFVLHAGRADKLGMVDLGNAGHIDETIAKLKEKIRDSKDIKESNMASVSAKLYKLVFEPLTKELGNKKEIFISPDGNLNLIPFEVLKGPNGMFLIEDYTFNYLAAGRDVLAFRQIKEQGNKALLMGDPDFDMAEKEKDATLRHLSFNKAMEKKITKRSLDMRGFHFTRLPGTKEEVKSIHDILGKDSSELYSGKQALEEVLKRKEAPKVLHLATHGFFLNDLEIGSLADESMGRGLNVTSKFQKPKRGKAKIENPLLRSGIALAGANNALKSIDAEKSDGIVTAEKILGLKLRGTEMVVLSACDTGLGEIKSGEGVFGLRRVFTQAGAKSLVMSMWSVPDKETKELMVEFYKNIRSGNMNRCQALRQAAIKEMMVVKERYGHENPFYWGAFVFLGEP